MSAGDRLRDAVSGSFDLDEHEAVLLDQAAATADVIEALQRVVDAEGPVKSGRVNHALVELRLQRLLLARLLAAIRLPDADDRQPQRRSMRGVYGQTQGS